MKILFLDIDGVLNETGGQIGTIVHEKLEILRDIRRRTGCKIILSSMWRKYPNKRREANAIIGLDGDTPILDHEMPNGLFSCPDRGEEIQEWLRIIGFPKTKDDRYAILDDNPNPRLYPELVPHFFQTDGEVGLTKEIAKQVIEHLNS